MTKQTARLEEEEEKVKKAQAGKVRVEEELKDTEVQSEKQIARARRQLAHATADARSENGVAELAEREVAQADQMTKREEEKAKGAERDSIDSAAKELELTAEAEKRSKRRVEVWRRRKKRQLKHRQMKRKRKKHAATQRCEQPRLALMRHQINKKCIETMPSKPLMCSSDTMKPRLHSKLRRVRRRLRSWN